MATLPKHPSQKFTDEPGHVTGGATLYTRWAISQILAQNALPLEWEAAQSALGSAFAGGISYLSQIQKEAGTAESLRVLEKPNRGMAPQQPNASSARLSQWEIMLLLKLVARSVGPAAATSLHGFMHASGRSYDLLTLDTFNILLQAWAFSLPTEASSSFDTSVNILDRYWDMAPSTPPPPPPPPPHGPFLADMAGALLA